jgi:hypothetical protein
MLRDAEGNRLYRRIEVKIAYPPDVFPKKTLIYRAQGARKAYGPEGIDGILMSVTDQLDQLYPWWEFEMVPLAPRGRVASYVFKVVGTKAITPAVDSIPSVETVESVETKSEA